MLFGKIPQSFCIRSFVWCLSLDYRTREFRVGAQVGDFCFDDFHPFMAPQITLLFLEFLCGFLCAPVDCSAYFWYRKRRIIGLSDGPKYFVHSLNVYPKLYLEHFNVYFRLVPWSGHALAALQMSVSSHVRLREYHTFISLQNSYAQYISSFLLSTLTNKG